MSCRTTPALLLLAGFAVGDLFAEVPADETEAVATIQRGIASNVQWNRDGYVRFVRFSKPIVKDEHLARIGAFSQLDYLAVVSPNVTDAGLTNIAGLPNLDTLYLSRSQLTDAGAAKVLRDLPKLERLYLDDTAIGDASLEQVAKLGTLTTISLRNTNVTDAGLAYLASLEHLEVLLLGGTAITDGGLAHLQSLPKLHVLHLDGTKVTGTGVERLAELQSLEELNLSGTRVEPGTLPVFGKSLKTLLLDDTDFARSNVEDIRGGHPKLVVSVSPPEAERRSALARFLAGEPLRSASTSNDETEPTEPGPLLAPANERFAATDEVPDFQRHVVPLLGRLGCNGRSCHGSFQGRGGFRLSMFGYDFTADHEALTKGDQPRVNANDPDASLILNKPTDELAHGGGKRFEEDGWEYDLLRTWIASGAKSAPQPRRELVSFETVPTEIEFGALGKPISLRAIATWSDGTREDVTPLTRFQSNDEAVAEVTAEGLVRSTGAGDTHVVAFYDNGVRTVPVTRPVSNRTGDHYPDVATPTRIDELITAKLRKLGIVPSEVCTDAEFLRRVSLDLIGTLPTPDEVRTFVADPSPDKRARKVDELLVTPAYVEWWTMRLADLTGCNSQYLGSTDMNSPAAEQWIAWLRRRVSDNTSWDRVTAGILLATSRRPGQSYESYAAEQSRFMSKTDPDDFTAADNPMHYYWFKTNNSTPTDRALAFGYVFLGVRLQCAQCHKHPFDRWSKQDFDRFATFFERIENGIAPAARETQNQLKTRLGVPTKLDTAALRRQMYLRVSAEGLPIPWNEIYIEPPGPQPQLGRLLGGNDFDLSDYDDPREPLAAWLLAKDNPYFARAFVNRIWSHHFGRGIVEPADDFNMANPPSNGPLLDWLAEEFVANGYDPKWLHRTILTSDAYQRSWRSNPTNANDGRHFSRSRVRRLPAEVTIDAILQATAGDAENRSYATNVEGRKIGQHPRSLQARSIDFSLLVFGKPLRGTNCDCERQVQPTLMQSLYFRNDTDILSWLERDDGWLAAVAKSRGETLVRESTIAAPTGRTPPRRPKPNVEPAGSIDPPTDDELITTAYLRTLGREPTDTERERSCEQLTKAESTTEGLRDVLWALLNTREFRTNH